MDELNKSLNDLINEAVRLLAVRNFEKALEVLRAAEVLDRENPAILYNIGITYTRLGLFKTALEYFQKIVLLPVSFIDIHNVKKNMAFCYAQTGNFKEALKLLDDILANFSSDIPALNMKAYCYQQLNMNEESLITYKEVLRNNKNDINSLNSTAYLMSLNGIQLESAYKLANIVIQRNGHNPAYLDTLGYICLKTGRIEEAEKNLLKALDILPFDKEIKEHCNELMKLKNEKQHT